MHLVKSISLDIKNYSDNNLFMIVEHQTKDSIVQEVLEEWREGDRLEEEGYDDLGNTLKLNAIEKATKLSKDARKEIANLLFPEN